MFTENQQWLMDRLLKSNFWGAHIFVINIQSQGFMSQKQELALKNMVNSQNHGKKHKKNSFDGVDHDDLAEGWDGF